MTTIILISVRWRRSIKLSVDKEPVLSGRISFPFVRPSESIKFMIDDCRFPSVRKRESNGQQVAPTFRRRINQSVHVGIQDVGAPRVPPRKGHSRAEPLLAEAGTGIQIFSCRMAGRGLTPSAKKIKMLFFRKTNRRSCLASTKRPKKVQKRTGKWAENGEMLIC
jgi:hypothetical protein